MEIKTKILFLPNLSAKAPEGTSAIKPIVKAKPTSPGRRGLVKVVHTDLHKGKPFRALVETLPKTGGRNNYGRITVRHIGGGTRTKYRIIDWTRNKDHIEATVEAAVKAVGIGLTTKVLEAVATPQEPPDEVSVSVAVPVYSEGGVHVAFRVVALGENVPPDTLEDHVPPVAEPPTLPPRAADVPPYYAAWHNKWALWSFVAFLILIASFSLCAYRLWRRSHPGT